MNFSLNDEQQMLKDAVERLLASEYDIDKRRARVAGDQGFDSMTWRHFAEQGWLAMLFDEDLGGFGGDAVELMIFMEAFGRHLVVEPFLSNIVLAGGILRNSAQHQQWLPRLMEGEIQATLAWVEPQARYDLTNLATRAMPTDDGWTLTGHKSVVPYAAAADLILAPARVDDQLALFALDKGSPGLELRSYPTIDGHHAADVILKDVNVTAGQRLTLDDPLGTLQSVVDQATLAVCAEAIGIMDVLLAKTVEYSRERKQFGVPISSFQVLQHRMVDMLMTLEQTRSLVLNAVIQAEAGSAESGAAIAAAKYYIGEQGRRFGEDAIQIHGGMGVTEELDVSHYFKRLIMIDTLFGNADAQLDRFCDMR